MTWHVSAVVFPGFEPLDLFGPLEFFSLLGDRAVVTLRGLTLEPVTMTGGMRVLPDTLLSDPHGCDLLLVPGGIGSRELVNHPEFLGLLKQASEKAAVTASVCTGSALLARAGLLDGRAATSNKLAWDWVISQSAKVRWDHEARWVHDDPFWTSAGISAGMDMALALIAHQFGQETATDVARRAEYFSNFHKSF